MTEQVECEKHGAQNEAYICSHLVSTLSDKVSRGLIWSRDEEGSINAYCIGCEDMLKNSGGEWTEEIQEQAGIVAACEKCIMPLFDLNAKERPV